MRLAWHIARKDLRRLRWPILGFGLLIAVQLILGALLITGLDGDFNWFLGIMAGNYVLLGLQAVTVYFLVAAFIHQDPISSSSAFWTTRPVSGATLLLAKFLGLAAAFGLFPVFLHLPWWLGCGYGIREIALATIEIVAWQALVVAIALPIATLTDGVNRYIVWTLILIASLATLALSVQASPTEIMDVARAVAAAALLVIGGVIATVVHFGTRRHSFSIGVVGVSLTAALGAFFYLPVSGETFLQKPQAPGRNEHAVSLALQRTYEGISRRDAAILHSVYRVDGLPANLALRVMGSENLWDLGGGSILGKQNSLHVSGGSYAARALKLEPESVAQAGSTFSIPSTLPRSSGADTSFVRLSSSTTVLPSIARRIQTENPPFTFRARFQLLTPSLLGEVEMVNGTKIVSGSSVSRIVKPTEAPFGRRGKFRSEVPTNNFEQYFGQTLVVAEHFPWVWKGTLRRISEFPNREYYFVNRARGTAFNAFGGNLQFVRIGTVAIGWKFLQLVSTESFDNATLAIIGLEPGEVFQTEFRVEEFRFSVRYREGAAP